MKFLTKLSFLLIFTIAGGVPSPGEQAEMNAQCSKVSPHIYVNLPSPSDCTVFYICDGGLAWIQYCPANLIFNPILHVCDHPEVSSCAQK